MFRPFLGHLQIVLYECEIYYYNISHSYNTICKRMGFHITLKYRYLLDLFSQRA